MRLNSIKTIKFCLALMLVFVSVITRAELQDEIQVYDDEINKQGEYSLELHVNGTPRAGQQASYSGERMNGGSTRITPELAYGLGHDLEAGLYINTIVYQGAWDYAGAKVRLKWLPITEEKGDPVFAGLNIELSNTLPQYEQSRYNSEARFILGKHVDDWLFVINPIFDQALSQPYIHTAPDFYLDARASRKITQDWATGVEYYSSYSDLGTQPINLRDTQQMAFLMVYCDAGPIPFQAGVGRGLTNSTDSLTFKAIFSIPLP